MTDKSHATDANDDDDDDVFNCVCLSLYLTTWHPHQYTPEMFTCISSRKHDTCNQLQCNTIWCAAVL